MVSDSVFPMRYSFEQILNEITCVNNFPVFILTIDFKLKILNHHCAPYSQQDNIVTFILT